MNEVVVLEYTGRVLEIGGKLLGYGDATLQGISSSGLSSCAGCIE